MVSSEDLHKKLTALCNSIEKKYWTYYFLESLDNFITFLDEIKSNGLKEKASNLINSSLNEIDSMYRNDESITHVYKYLYSTYIYYLEDIYRSELGFVRKPYILLDLIIVIVIFIIILMFSNFLFSIISVSLFIAFYLAQVIPKIRKGKYY